MTKQMQVFFEPTSVPKSLKLFKHFETTQPKSIKYISPNQFELEALCERIHSDPLLYKQIKPINPPSLNSKKEKWYVDYSLKE